MAIETSDALQGPEVAASPTVPGTVQGSIGSRAGEFIVDILRIREMAMVALILLTGVIMSICSPYFLSLQNFIAIARGFSMEGVVVVGMTLLLISGNLTCRWVLSWPSPGSSRRGSWSKATCLHL